MKMDKAAMDSAAMETPVAETAAMEKEEMTKKKLIGFYDYTVVLTYAGMLFAFTGIMDAIRQNFSGSIVCLMIAGLCDMFDGAVASTKDRNRFEKHFGIEIDSMCDLISFGVLPGVFVFMITGMSRVAGYLSAFYVLCALIRLAYYNVQELERQKTSGGCRECFLGVPVTTIAMLLPLIYLIMDRLGRTGTTVYLVMAAVVAVGFVSGIEVKKPQKVGKIVLLVIGLAELFGMILLAGARIV